MLNEKQNEGFDYSPFPSPSPSPSPIPSEIQQIQNTKSLKNPKYQIKNP